MIALTVFEYHFGAFAQSLRPPPHARRSEEHTSELQSQSNLVCRLLLEKKQPDLLAASGEDRRRSHDAPQGEDEGHLRARAEADDSRGRQPGEAHADPRRVPGHALVADT